jgi:hypothetical protein
MAQEKIKVLSHWRLLSFVVLVALTGFASISGATYSLPADRATTWAGNVGVTGDIPARTTIYTTLAPSGGNDTTAIQTALKNCPSGQVVALKSGTFNISSPIVVKSGITLRGAGMGVTTIKGASGMGGVYLIGFNAGPSEGSSLSASGLTKGSNSITTTSAHGWSVGDIIMIDQLNNASGSPVVTNVGNNGTCSWCGRASGTRSLGQMNKVVAVPSSTTATLDTPLSWKYASSQSPQAVKVNGMTANAGIEDLSVDNSASGSSSQGSDGATVVMYGASNCWLLRVEAIGSWETMVRIKRGYRNTIRACKLHEGTPALPISGYATSRAYGLWIAPGSGNLIENNQLYHLFMPVAMNNATSGNVFAYNYITELYYNNTNWNLGVFEFHGAHPSMNLFEGNYGDGRLLADDVWGSSSNNTFFRNRQSLSPNKSGAAWNVDLQSNAQYYNFIGNVLGTSGVESLYELNNVTLAGQKSIFRFGYTGDGDGSASGNDSQVAATVLLHGNWDSVNKSVVWNGSNDVSLPASMYLTSKPSWWGNMQWPAVGPDVSPMYPAAPGAGKGTPWGDTSSTSQSIPSAPASLVAQ